MDIRVLVITSCVLMMTSGTIYMFKDTIKYDETAYSFGGLSIYVADIPDNYVTGVAGWGPAETNLQYGYAALGGLLSTQHQQWASVWHSNIAWYINQIKTSPLRTYDAASADIVFVPAMMMILNPAQHNQFISEAHQFLPYLSVKPHLVILSHAPSVYSRGSDLLMHNNSHNFVFVSWGQLNISCMAGVHTECPVAPPVPTRQSDDKLQPGSNVVGSPALSFVHWSRGSEQLRTYQRVFDAQAVERSKTTLAVESFLVRDYPDRFALYEDCKGAPEDCKHLEFNSAEDAVGLYEACQSAWYVLHPRGDFVIRNSFFDTLLADAIPVLFQSEYIDSVPFTDVIDYTKMVVYIPEKEVLNENRTNLVNRLAKDFVKAEALTRIEYIHNIKHLFQYMLNPDHLLIRWDQRSTIDPDDDAFTFTMKSVLRNLCTRNVLKHKCATAKGRSIRRMHGPVKLNMPVHTN